MKKIGFITATPPSFNPGMLVCELMAKAFTDTNGLSDHSVFFRLTSMKELLRYREGADMDEILKKCDTGIPFNLLNDPQLLHDMIPLYWGDFQHMFIYINVVSKIAGVDIDKAYELLLLSDVAEDLRKRVHTFGSSFLFNSTEELFSEHYGRRLKNFLKSCSHVQMRDAISAAIAASCRDSNENCMGVDPAQLLAIPAYEEKILGPVPVDLRDDPGKSVALLFFARGDHDDDRLSAFLDSLAHKAYLKTKWLDWGDRLSFPFLRGAWKGITPAVTADIMKSDMALMALLKTIRSARCVITDTYHLCAISWAMGIPAVMIPGDYHPAELIQKKIQQRVRHDKRKILLGQDGLLDFHIEPRLIDDEAQWDGITDRLTRDIMNEGLQKEVRNSIAARAGKSAERLSASLKQSLGIGR
jgi:hypothetical protein